MKVHENSLFLYKSNQADSVLRSRMMDYLFFGCIAGLVTGASPFLILPLVLAGSSQPRKIAGITFFTFHAELLPHTEQVVFHKATYFGKVRRIYVDIKNLEKIEAELVPSKTHSHINIILK